VSNKSRDAQSKVADVGSAYKSVKFMIISLEYTMLRTFHRSGSRKGERMKALESVDY